MIKMLSSSYCLLFLSMGLVIASPKPNIVVIYADDLGYGDLSCYGATKIKTPHLDTLASEGMKFTDAHSAASLCSPSRYGLMMGLEVGFDYHFGVPTNHNDSNRAFIENHDIVGRKKGEDFRIVKGRDFPEGLAKPRIEDLVDTVLTEKAVNFIEENAGKPFFLYFTPCAPHTHVTPAAAFRGKSEAGLYGDHIQELDSHVGTILQTLDRLELRDKTLVIFTSDNGSTPKDFKGSQNTKLNLADDSGDIRKKFKTAKKDAKEMGHVTNGPWRDGKGYSYEGGHRVPFIVRWPGKIKEDTSSDYTFNLTDVFATAAEVIESELPKNAAKDSISLLPVLLGQEKPDREAIFIQGNGKDSAIAVCTGRWKLIVRTGEGEGESYELYDLANDRGETNNVAEENSAITQKLAIALRKAEEAGRTRP